MDIRDLLSSSAEILAQNETNFTKKELEDMLQTQSLVSNSALILSKKENKFRVKQTYTEQELKDMLKIQSMTEYDIEHELNSKLICICEEMKKQYKLSSIPTSMILGVANEIFKQVEKGVIVNVAELEGNSTIAKVAQTFCEKQQIVENFSATMQGKELPHQIEKLVEGTNYIASSVEVARAFENLNTITESEKKIADLFNNFTEESFDKDREEARKIWESQERKSEVENETENLKLIYENGTETEKYVAMNIAITNEIIETRMRMTPEEQEKSKFQANGVLFNYLCILNSPISNLEKIVHELQNYVFKDGAFSRDENYKLRDMLRDATSKDEVAKILLDSMEQIALENGIEFDRGFYEHLSKQGNRTHTFGKISDVGRLNGIASLILPKERKKDYTDFVKKITNLKKNIGLSEDENQYEPIDLTILEEIKEYDRELYLDTLRTFGKYAKESNNKWEQERAERLLDEATEETIWKNVLKEKLKKRSDLTPSEREKKKEEIGGILFSFMRSTNSRTENIEYIKNEFLAYLAEEEGMDAEEKRDLFEKIKVTKDKNEFSTVLLDKAEEVFLRNGKNFDRERILKVAQRKVTKNGVLLGKFRADARAKVRLDKFQYEKYLLLTDCLRNKEYNGEYDLSLIDEIKDTDEVLYRELLSNVEMTGKRKNDDSLLKFSGERMSQKNSNLQSNVISVRKVTTETVVETFGDGNDALMNSSKKIQEATAHDDDVR